ncbi:MULTISPECIES: glutathione S-transferase family protein [Thalassospira]|uniref:Glutathione S-transferase n=1 Tax=Thalassospira profundimaris TaxID=502049 RepID=A0A367V699_9PROT|nr:MULTISPECIES: glutathione S-transferase [Thalassospira]KZB70568.1 glutathione S-transferase [Thalassospira sp. MCCC 1A01148]RCK19882.1 glutathione S-transferase [Thalassospira profundimaris]
MKLYHHPISGHAHRARLFLGLLGLEHELVEVDLANGAHKSPEFLKLNPLGQVPVLEDGDKVITDSNAIMVYLAKKTGATNWLPEDAEGAARVQRWLSIAAGQIAFGPAAARLITLFGAPFDADEVISRAHAVLGNIEDHLKTNDWLAASHPTIADVALYSYVARAPEGNVDLAAYGKVRDWLKRIEDLAGFVPFMHAPEEMLKSA